MTSRTPEALGTVLTELEGLKATASTTWAADFADLNSLIDKVKRLYEIVYLVIDDNILE